MQSGCTYQKFRAPARLALTLHACRARVQLNRALAHLFQPSQGRLNEPQARFKTPSVSTPLENNRTT